ncbi:hypothetical protein ZOSMA_54G00740 [Zostera marina]|uniref:AAA+ ATPase domain-containing protein n=1 Tax=Zostera marina TaxID=29655 RepID=A0A0K9NWX5_ZOSMR|nr:hypothetical protein ZOSMA_54G00740 [Zostera marina]
MIFSLVKKRFLWRNLIGRISSSYGYFDPIADSSLRSGFRDQGISVGCGSGEYRCGFGFTSRVLCSAALLFGASSVFRQETVLADAGIEGIPAPETTSNFKEMEKLASQERRKLEELISSKGMQRGTYPSFAVAVKGSKVTVKFQIPQTCDVPCLIVNLVSTLGLKSDHHDGPEMIMRAWDSEVAWQLSLSPLESHKEKVEEGYLPKSKDLYAESLSIFLFKSLLNSDNSEIEFIKQGSFNSKDLDAIVSTLRLSGARENIKKSSGKNSGGIRGRNGLPAMAEKSLSSLEAMGVRVYGVENSQGVPVKGANGMTSWDIIAGYEHQKREIEDTILLYESNRPRAVLFEGPPGTGKTSCARVIANQAGVPLLYVPLEVVVSKYYGESERLLGSVFSLANELPDGAIIFLDEVDSFAAARDSEMHEATRRLLSVILRQIDGFEQEKKIVVIAATNRKEDLDPALISRFDSMIFFNLPDQKNREEIVAQYAKQFKRHELVQLAAAMEGMSGRDIRDVCQQAERSWASKIIRGEVLNDTKRIPPLDVYIKCAEIRQESLLDVAEKKRASSHRFNKIPLGLL